MKFDAQKERFIPERFLPPAKVDRPAAGVGGRHQLVRPLNLFLDLLSQQLLVKSSHFGLLEAFLKSLFDIRLDIRHRLSERTARDEYFVRQNGLLRGWQLAGTPSHEAEHRDAGKAQKQPVEHHDPHPFAEPDLPAS